MFSKKFLSGAALTALSLASGVGAAHAQSTASQMEDEVIVTGTRQSTAGLMSAEQAPRARTTIGAEYIEAQNPGQSILNTINLAPGVNFTNNDAYGSSGGNITMRGFDNARISLTFDGLPLNDSGNYAIFSNQQVDPELIERANVNLGATEVDSPTASATGGTVNIVSRRPADEFGVTLAGAHGDFNFNRLFAMVDTGSFANTSAYLAASTTSYDQFIGPGGIEKQQYNGRIYHEMGDDGDFVALAFHYNENRADFYRTFNLATFNSGAWPYNEPTCARLTAGPGIQRETTTPTGTTPTCTNFYGVRINPSNTGNIRGQSRWSLSDALTLTIDPSFQYVRANGGGVEAVAEDDIRLRGQGAVGVSLNGDADTVDRIQLYSPSNTATYRYGLTSSLIWDVNATNRLRVGYTMDYARHRQTGEYGVMGPDGFPEDVFGGRLGTAFNTAEGDVFQKRNRFSIASLSQLSAEYRGDFMDDRLTLIVGARAPMFERELDQHCYAVKGSTSSTQFCTTRASVASPTSPGFRRFDANGDGDVLDTNVNGFNETTDYSPPFTANVEYEDVLPNVGLTYRPMEDHQIFVSYAEGLSAPRTDDLYGGILPTQLSTVVPETSKAYDLGYRYQGADLIFSATAWYNQFSDRIVRSQDPFDPSVSFARNVGDVDLWGYDAQLGYNFTEVFTVYGSAAYTMSELQSNLPGQTQGAGNQLVDTPEWTLSARGEYEIGPVQIGLQAKYVGERFTNDFNTEALESYTLVDLDVRWALPDIWSDRENYLQLNVINLLDESYLGTINSSGANGATGFFNLGAPRTAMISLHAEF